MRWAVVAAVAVLSVGTAFAQNGGSEIVIPPAPPLVPEAPSPPLTVQQVQPQPPQGLVPAAPPPADGNASTPLPPDTGNEGNGISPAAPDAPLVLTPGQPMTNAAPPPSPQPPPPDVAPPLPDNWAPGTSAVLGVLNKVDGSTALLTLNVGGQTQTTGDLNVSVQACLNRPAGQLPDTAIFVTVAPVQSGASPLYRGWMLRSAPGATFVGNAGQTIRVISCT